MKKSVQMIEEEPAHKMAIEEASNLLMEDRADRISAVGEEIKLILSKYNCGLDVQITISGKDGVVGSQIIVVPLDFE